MTGTLKLTISFCGCSSVCTGDLYRDKACSPFALSSLNAVGSWTYEDYSVFLFKAWNHSGRFLLVFLKYLLKVTAL